MATQTLNYLDAIAHLPAGGTLILNEVPWDEYGMGVPEVWRYDGKRPHMYQLVGQDYLAVNASRVLPVFTTDVLSRFLEQGKTEGQTAVRRSFRDWLRAQKP